jgi:hypothetical protein
MNEYSKEIDIFNASVENAATLSLIVRDSDLQRGALAQLTALAANVEDWKRRAIAKRDENGANLFLGCECVIEALSAELNMWLHLKNSQPDDAWNSLVVAQMATRDAMRADSGFSHLEARAVRLVNIERVVFPDQVFLSVGLVVRHQECSICGAEYGECPHLVGMPYMGEFCRCILRDIAADHVAIVKEPANKQCRIVYFNAQGGKRNRMTWRVEPDAIAGGVEDGGAGRNGLMASAILLSTSDVGAKRGKK